jgi:hypothetical protein
MSSPFSSPVSVCLLDRLPIGHCAPPPRRPAQLLRHAVPRCATRCRHSATPPQGPWLGRATLCHLTPFRHGAMGLGVPPCATLCHSMPPLRHSAACPEWRPVARPDARWLALASRPASQHGRDGGRGRRAQAASLDTNFPEGTAVPHELNAHPTPQKFHLRFRLTVRFCGDEVSVSGRPKQGVRPQ